MDCGTASPIVFAVRVFITSSNRVVRHAYLTIHRAPRGPEQDTYLVLDDFGGRLGCSWREASADSVDRETLIRDLVDGQYTHPVRIVAFNTAEGWSRDVTVDLADELRRRYVEFGEVPDSILDFMESNRR